MIEPKNFPKSDYVDVMLFSEGTYPYVKGGVSSWIFQLMTGLPEISFGVCFVGASEIVDGKKLEVSYTFPDNLLHLETHYLFDEDTTYIPKRREGSKEGFEAVEELYASFKSDDFTLPKMLENLDFYSDVINFEDFLYSKKAWDFISKIYEKNCPDVPFVDYFWTLRNIHKPIWILADIVKGLPKTGVFHAPSTGYAGFLGSLASFSTHRPFILTEHGIYTRERKIDMLSADWIEYKKPELLQQPEEYNYIKKMWIDFFEKIGVFCYNRSNMILSLFNGARKIQIAYGADENRCFVIPNGVDVDGLKATMTHRDPQPKPIVTLIGRVVPIKDIKTFIRAIKIALQSNPDIEAWIVGPIDEDLEYFDECQQMAVSLGLKKEKQEFDGNISKLSQEELIANDDKVKFFGFSNIKEILPKSALQTLSSISEGMPLVILEGFAAGVPCVATDVGSCRDLIEGGIDDQDIKIGQAGAVTGIANPGALAKEYVRLLDFETGAWNIAQKAGLERVEKYYRQESFLQDYKDIYTDALKCNWDEYMKTIFPFYNHNKIPYVKQFRRGFPIVRFVAVEEEEV
jgi:glycosyltransferase involved in cell wall biosynthesis